MAVIGLAAFSPGTVSADDGAQTTAVAVAAPAVSARVASAVLAVRVTDAGTRVATPIVPRATTTTGAPVQAETLNIAETGNTVFDATATTAPATTAPPTTAPPTTEQQAAATTAATTPPTTKPGDTTPPPITITSPRDKANVTDRLVTFSGTSEPGATVVSGPYAATMSDDGSWTIKLAVSDGANGAKFTATDDAGNTATASIVVYYDEPTTTTTTPATTTTKPATTTTTPATTTTTSGSSNSKWSPNWPADAGGTRSIESWRTTVEKYWPADRVDCALGIIKRESNGDPRAFNSSTSAEGLMQHLSKYWTSRAKGAGFVDGNGLVASPYNGEANIAAGAFLANYYDSATGQWWNPWKSGGKFTATYGSCQSSNPG